MAVFSSGYCSLTRADTAEGNPRIPAFIYGSAWKGEKTAHLVSQALEAGFTAIDTAAQPRHYREDLVGEAVRQHLDRDTLKREDLFVKLYNSFYHSLAGILKFV